MLAELEQIAEISTDRNIARSSKSRNTYIANEEIRIKHYVEGLSVLGHKCNISDRKDELSLHYQHLRFTLIRLYPENDEFVAGSISLLALIAKDTRVQKRFKYQADDYVLNQPIAVLRKILERAKDEKNETKEAVLAEIHRKRCLFHRELYATTAKISASHLLLYQKAVWNLFFRPQIGLECMRIFSAGHCGRSSHYLMTIHPSRRNLYGRKEFKSCVDLLRTIQLV